MNPRPKPPPPVPTGLGPEGSHPVKQERSRKLRDKVLAHAHELVEQGRYDATTMAGIAAAVGCSVGALYQRFRDKEALFASVIEIAMARELDAIRANASSGRYRDLGLRETVGRCVQDYERFLRRNASMVRTLYQRGIEQPGSWNGVRVPTFHMVQIWVESVVLAAGHGGERDFVRQVGIAFQYVGGALVHAVLIGPLVRPLSIRETLFWLDEMVMHFIGLDVPESLRGTPFVMPAATASIPAMAKRAPTRTRANQPTSKRALATE